ncbi:GspH/FimT family pseudopilin [Pseudomonas sp. SL4(2022)]|uniref:GspH/FimT family pseudopilin n=1 Tax=Pseudomonas sp. SL4(2022) TaxID=2994661 RepID=UPI00226D8A26|nr:GspH/FimT family pseudopilin [Pseudomonas sp. SL4(2022)]WAC42999.1 GspH/FimT family pseudopilin [Pseudomonas sp. SL4(2022)]
MKRNSTGTSLIELLTGIGILGISASLAIPALQDAFARHQLTSTSSALYSLTHQARLSAINRQSRVSLCPLAMTGECSANWQLPISIFTDFNGNRRLDPEDEILKTHESPSNVEISWRGMGNSKSLHFNRQGITFVSNGTLHLRSGNRTIRLTINRLGKIKAEAIAAPPTP